VITFGGGAVGWGVGGLVGCGVVGTNRPMSLIGWYSSKTGNGGGGFGVGFGVGEETKISFTGCTSRKIDVGGGGGTGDGVGGGVAMSICGLFSAIGIATAFTLRLRRWELSISTAGVPSELMFDEAIMVGRSAINSSAIPLIDEVVLVIVA